MQLFQLLAHALKLGRDETPGGSPPVVDSDFSKNYQPHDARSRAVVEAMTCLGEHVKSRTIVHEVQLRTGFDLGIEEVIAIRGELVRLRMRERLEEACCD